MSSYMWWLLGYEEPLPEITNAEKNRRHVMHKQIKTSKLKLKKKDTRNTKEQKVIVRDGRAFIKVDRPYRILN